MRKCINGILLCILVGIMVAIPQLTRAADRELTDIPEAIKAPEVTGLAIEDTKVYWDRQTMDSSYIQKNPYRYIDCFLDYEIEIYQDGKCVATRYVNGFESEYDIEYDIDVEKKPAEIKVRIRSQVELWEDFQENGELIRYTTKIYSKWSEFVSLEMAPVTTKIYQTKQTNTTITIEWTPWRDAVNNKKSYNLYLAEYGIHNGFYTYGKFIKIGKTKSTEYKIEGLKAGRRYAVKIKIGNEYEIAEDLVTLPGSVTFTGSNWEVAPITMYTIDEGAKKEITVNWKSIENAAGCKVVVYSSTGKKLDTIDKELLQLYEEGSVNIYIDTYKYKNSWIKVEVTPYTYLRGKQIYGTAKTTYIVSQPGIEKIVRQSKGIKVQWQKIKNAKSYTIAAYKCDNTGKYTKVGQWNTSKTNKVISGLDKNQTYYFCVTASCKIKGKTIKSKGNAKTEFSYEDNSKTYLLDY